MIVALAGGTGAAKLLRGLARVTDPSRLFIVGNTGDDLEWWGLHVSPDLDSVAYALAGLLDGGRGWGVRDDTDTRVIDNFIVRLRRYVEDRPGTPKFLLTVRGVGYRFVPGGDATPRSS